jgi:hypothetical protein
MGKNNWSSGFQQKNGQSLVEFAAGITLLLIILAGVVDVSRLLFTYLTYRDAAEEGALYGSVFPTYCNQIQDRSLSTLGYPSGVQANVKVDAVSCLSATSNQACLGHTITVEVRDPNFDITMPFLGAIIGTNHFPLSASVINTIVRTPCH